MALAISGTLALTEARARSAYLPRILYRDHFRDGTVTASGAQPDHPVSMAFDAFTDTAWIGETGAASWWLRVSKPGARSDYAALLLWSAGLTIRPQYSTDGGETWIDAAPPAMPVDRVVAFLFDAVTADDWRILFEGDAPPEVAHVSLGEATVLAKGLQVGFEPPKQARHNAITNNNTDQGHLAGRSVIRKGIRTSFSLRNADAAWVREAWEPFIDHAETRPFYFIWSPVNWPNEVALLWTRGDIAPPQYTSERGYMSVSLDVEGFAR